MSGDMLRHAARVNDVDSLRSYCLLKTNPCSVDEHGLTALHYAVWNGNVDCVKYLVMNPRGITKDRQRISCVSLQSNVGYTALHLAALECPKVAVKDITTVLLLAGIDFKLLDKDGHSAYDIATKSQNEIFLEVFREFIDAMKGKIDSTLLRATLSKLKKDYQLHAILPLTAEQETGSSMIQAVESYSQLQGQLVEQLQWERDHQSVGPTFSSGNDNLNLADATSLRKLRAAFDQTQRVGKLPRQLAIGEHLILPLAEFGYYHQQGTVDSLHTLRFAAEQGTKNAERRKKIMQSSGKEFVEFDPEFKF